MSDVVFIEALEIDALIGIYDWERRVRQTLSFDIEMEFDNRVPAASDDITQTLNYKAVSKRLVEYVQSTGFGLVETLAERCAEIILQEFFWQITLIFPSTVTTPQFLVMKDFLTISGWLL